MLPAPPPPGAGLPLELLTADELATYNRLGYLVPAAPLLTRKEVELHADVWEQLLAAEGEPGQGFSVNGAFKRWGQGLGRIVALY